jgi:lipopolysaccharide/colanic/teichoic acid biosynthesis glycosyltransferase
MQDSAVSSSRGQSCRSFHPGFIPARGRNRAQNAPSIVSVFYFSILPLLVPVFLAIRLAVRLTSRGPVLFTEMRMGRHGQNFTILKFRTMIHNSNRAHHPVTTSGNQRLTPIGPLLRRWKLDELPQLLNMLSRHMSIVGLGPKLPEHAISKSPLPGRNHGCSDDRVRSRGNDS